MKTLITGCDLVDIVRDRWCHGDLWKGQDIYVFNACLMEGETAWNYWSEGLGAKRIAVYGEFFKRRGVIAFPDYLGQLNPEAIEYVERGALL